MVGHVHNIAIEWTAQNSVGRREAIEVVELIRAEDIPFVLGHRVKIMIERGEFGGREVGFFHYIATELRK